MRLASILKEKGVLVVNMIMNSVQVSPALRGTVTGLHCLSSGHGSSCMIFSELLKLILVDCAQTSVVRNPLQPMCLLEVIFS